MYNSPVYLTNEQIDKLRRVLTHTMPICPSPVTLTFPTLHITPTNFLRNVLLKLKQHSIHVSSICLHGGAASYVLVNDSDFIYRDIDILFHIQTALSSQQQTNLFSSNNQTYSCDVWTIIKYIVSSCLIEHLSPSSNCTQYFVSSVLDAYSKKNVRIASEQDSWALLSLRNLLGQNLELKFVENLKRQWQFSVDSFEIDIKSILMEETSQFAMTTNINTEQQSATCPLDFNFFTPSTSPEHSSNHYSTLANLQAIKSRSISPKISSTQSDDDDDDDDNNHHSQKQIQISTNEDIDDGIGNSDCDSTNDDDEQVYRTPVDSDISSATNSTAQVYRTPIDSDVSSATNSMIQVYSFYKDLHQALYHLNNKLISTYEPETMRGGGLLKYCDLLARNYKPYDQAIMTHMQRYMCSRFFIDYKTLREQLHVIAQYVSTHYLPSSKTSQVYTTNSNEFMQLSCQLHHYLMTSHYNNEQPDSIDFMNACLCLKFFEHLISVLQQSTVCLTHEDRDLVIYNLHLLRDYYHLEYDNILIHDNQHYQQYHVYNNSTHFGSNTSSNSSRSSSPSTMSNKSYGNYRPNSNRHYPRYYQNNYHRQTVSRRNQS